MIWAGFLFGLLGSFHCVGMCGPIAMALPFNRQSGWQYVLGRVVYNGGRILTYTTLGLLAGLFGQTLKLAGMQQTVSIVSGILILLLVVLPSATQGRISRFTGMDKVLNKVRQLFAYFFQKSSFGSLAVVGMLNGLLPCGFVYIALAGALSITSLGGSMLYMALFGLGTLPLMLLVSLSGKLVRPQWRHYMNKMVPYVAGFMAVLFILRGLSLGIPYLSPQVVQQENREEMACCHK